MVRESGVALTRGIRSGGGAVNKSIRESSAVVSQAVVESVSALKVCLVSVVWERNKVGNKSEMLFFNISTWILWKREWNLVNTYIQSYYECLHQISLFSYGIWEEIIRKNVSDICPSLVLSRSTVARSEGFWLRLLLTFGLSREWASEKMRQFLLYISARRDEFVLAQLHFKGWF